MAITWKQQKFIDEYMADLNATQAAIRAGYSEKTAYSQGSRLLSNVEIKAEVERRMKATRMTADDIVKRLEDMAEGMIPTKWVKSPSRIHGQPTVREEYDTRGALQDLGKVYALFVDKQIVENIGLEVIDDDEEIPDNQECDR